MTTTTPRFALPPRLELLRAAQQFAIDPARSDYRSRLQEACIAMRRLVNAGEIVPGDDTSPWDFLAECELCLCEPPSAADHARTVIRAAIASTGHRLESSAGGVRNLPAPARPATPRQHPSRRSAARKKPEKRTPDLSWQRRADLQ